MNGFTWAWIVWLVVTVGGFLALEIPAIIRRNDSEKDPDTLSDHLALWFSVKTRKGRITWAVFASALGALVAWLGMHIITGQAV